MLPIKGHAAQIKVYIGNSLQNGTLDSGAESIFISKQWCINAGFKINAQTTTSLITATPGRWHTCGISYIVITIGGYQFKEWAHVIDHLELGLLLGWPFIKKINGVITATHLIVDNLNIQVPLIMQDNLPDVRQTTRCTKASVSEKLFIPGRTTTYFRDCAQFSLPDQKSVETRLIMGEGATKEEKKLVLKLLLRHPVLCREYLPNAPPPLPLQPIELPIKKGSIPPHMKQFPISLAARQAMDEMLGEWIRLGIVEPAVGNGNLPIFPIIQHNKLRIVLDGRATNELLEKVTHAPPHMSEIYKFMSNAKIACSIDAAAWFHQFQLKKEDRRFFSFDGGRHGRLQMTRLPQGSAIAPAIASAYLEMLLRPLSDIAISYVDNIVIKTTDDNSTSMLTNLIRVLKVLARAEVTLNLKSSVWYGRYKVPVLGALWSVGSFEPKPSRITGILEMPRPIRLGQMRSMVAALSTLSSFIPKAQLLAAPFNRLIGLGKPVKWESALESAWIRIRSAVSDFVKLNYHTPGEQLIVRSDASLMGWGGALFVRRGNKDLPVVFISQAWKGKEGTLSAVKREAKALLLVVLRLRSHILCEPNVIFETDSYAVSRILDHANDDFLGRIGIALSAEGIKSYQLRHVKGILNTIADWGSRVPASATANMPEKAILNELPLNISVVKPHLQLTSKPDHELAGWITSKQQELDPMIQQLRQGCILIEKAKTEPTILVNHTRLRDMLQRFRLHNDILYRIEYSDISLTNTEAKLVVVVPQSEEQRILNFIHVQYGHPRGERFITQIRQRFWMPQMIEKARDFTRRCETCQLCLAKAPIQPGFGERSPEGIGQHIYVDHGYVGMDHLNAEKLFLVIVDQVSGHVAAAAVPSRSSQDTIDALHSHWIRPYGPPRVLTSDNAKEFLSSITQKYLRAMAITFRPSSPRNPQSNIAETAVKKIKDGLRRALTDIRFTPLLRHAGWTGVLDAVVYNWNLTYSSTTGTVPSTLFFGRELRHPSDGSSLPAIPIGYPLISTTELGQRDLLRDMVMERREQQQLRKHPYFDRTLQRLIFPIGSQVLLCNQTSGPLNQDLIRVTGPYVIQRRCSDTTYQLAHQNGITYPTKVHVRWLQPYLPKLDRIAPSMDIAGVSAG